MATSNLAKLAGISAYTILIAALVPLVSNISSPLLTSLINDFHLPNSPLLTPFKFLSNNTIHNLLNTTSPEFTCNPNHTYTTTLISLSPPLIYIHSLLTPAEIIHLLSTASSSFRPSTITTHSSAHLSSTRTSTSAGLPVSHPAVSCILARTRHFLGTALRDSYDEMGPPQLVRYTAGQHFSLHHDWYPTNQWSTLPDDDFRKWNRVASFFAILQDNCTGGETHFPFVRPIVEPRGEEKPYQGGVEEGRPLWREHEDGGLAFRPVAGNALFWVNLHENGTGDMRTRHAGLPLGEGLKTAMNIWPKRYFPWD